MITIFNSIFKSDTPFHVDISYVLDLIKSGKNKEIIEQIRSEKDKEKRNEIKKTLKGICFSGKFSKRNNNSVLEHSGFIVLDYDDVKDLSKLKKEFSKNKYVYACFISPSGNGLKTIFRVPESIEEHEAYFVSLCETFDFDGIDHQTKDIARVCFESYDPDIYINEDCEVWEEKKEFEIVKFNEEVPKYFQITDENTRINVMINWFNKKFTFAKGMRNNNLFKLSAALNKVGIDKSKALNIIRNNFPSLDLTESEIETTLNSAYKLHAEHGTFILKDNNKIAQAKNLTSDKIKRKMLEQGYSSNEISDVQEFDLNSFSLDFWTISDKGRVTVNDYMFKQFLQNNGFFKLKLNEEEYTFVKLKDNILTDLVGAKRDEIKNYVLKYLEDREEITVFNQMSRNTRFFEDKYLNMIDDIHLQILEDDRYTSYFYFKNGCVKVTKEGTELIDYIDCGGLVWDNQIMERSFNPTDEYSCDFQKFINNVSKDDPYRKDGLERAIGFLLHRYKKATEAFAVIIYDESNSENPDGGTGKTLISTAIKQIRCVGYENGKNFDTGSNFAYQNINQSHDVFCIDDLKKNFNFESLFPIITQEMPINKKNKQPIIIPFRQSPKMYITSNYILKGEGNSHERRKLEIELFRYYKQGFTPEDEFGRMFFDEWDDAEYNKFYNYMVSCLQKYMKQGIIKMKLITGLERKLVESTNNSFMVFMENEVIWRESQTYNSSELLKIYKNEDNNEIPMYMNSALFGRWVNSYIKYKGWEKSESIDIKGRGRCFNIDFKGKLTNKTKQKTEDIFEEDDNELF